MSSNFRQKYASSEISICFGFAKFRTVQTKVRVSLAESSLRAANCRTAKCRRNINNRLMKRRRTFGESTPQAKFRFFFPQNMAIISLF